MCGIFGIFPNLELKSKNQYVDILKDLYKLSETRGHDASGLAILTNERIDVYKEALPANRLVKTKSFNELLNNFENIQAVMGHARMETNGSFNDYRNNQPVVRNGMATIHNGIIVNDEELWKKYPEMRREFNVDTEVINALIFKFESDDEDIINAYLSTLKLLKGSYSLCTFIDNSNYVLLSTNTGSLYRLVYKNKTLMFASERYFLEEIINKHFIETDALEIRQVKPSNALIIDIVSGKEMSFKYEEELAYQSPIQLVQKRKVVIEGRSKKDTPLPRPIEKKDIEKLILDEYNKNLEKVISLKRCTKCILPETMPFIEFDEEGVCNYCRNYQKTELFGKEELEREIAKFKEIKDKPNCIVAFSGGRDSSYGLHYIKKELGLNPVAYSYDWGMLTDLGRRNQARMTGSLGVEHILISADIQRKRENIRKNVEAWLKHPDLGTVPLFMAGDKQYFYYANLLKKQMRIDLVILCENLLERTDFKSGFCGIAPKQRTGKNFYSLSLRDSFKLMAYYGKEYLRNPAYINSSLLDSLWAFQSYYFIPHNYLSLYKYIKWDEETVENTLETYDWEVAIDTPTTWRIGDGTAAFYNYIYYRIAGFSENDTFRSNQIREGVLNRDRALEIAARDNKPRPDSMIWYGETINTDIAKAVKIINQCKKRF